MLSIKKYIVKKYMKFHNFDYHNSSLKYKESYYNFKIFFKILFKKLLIIRKLMLMKQNNIFFHLPINQFILFSQQYSRSTFFINSKNESTCLWNGSCMRDY